MRRRQAQATEPQKEVKTEFVIPNERKEPEIARRRRTELASQFGTAVDLSERIIQQVTEAPVKTETVEIVAAIPEIGLGTGKRRGRPARIHTQ